ncbi:MAG: tRNA (adenosine(37)-N6)-threonylcarbamoyltransferase complex dimerization subunit type 1 TsaB [Flavobacteriaceae bacterium]|nr:tRNA (adenosine(37)-N6)-threonylcarbamoyltransferase complex dimerization subunit type 1 TsaB [Flavobacteriaceae bacterium]
MTEVNDIFILQIETATTNCSVAISKNGKTIAIREISNGFSHAENLHTFIKELVESQKMTWNDFQAIAVSKGPGSYTGLRIGVSTAKGLCYALDLPLISIETLKSLACQVAANSGVIIPMIDARRMEAYTAVFDVGYNELRETEAEIVESTSYDTYLSEGNVFFIGNAVEKTQSVISHENANFIEGKLPSASEMSFLAYEKYKKSDIEDVAYFEPYYLKDFVVTPSKK